jgi:hypothetical protein
MEVQGLDQDGNGIPLFVDGVSGTLYHSFGYTVQTGVEVKCGDEA